jgi:hypothetical protein
LSGKPWNWTSLLEIQAFWHLPVCISYDLSRPSLVHLFRHTDASWYPFFSKGYWFRLMPE